MHSSPGSFLLQWFVGIGTELVIPKVVFQIAMKVQSTMAIATTFFTWGIAEYLQYILHFREIDNNPPRCYRVGMCRIYKGKGISQSTGILTDEIIKFCMLTYLAFICLSNKITDLSAFDRNGPDHTEKSSIFGDTIE